MSDVQPAGRAIRAQAAKDLSTSFAELMPSEGSDVGAFLFEAAYALGEREADLARYLGVSHATLSSWKKRGSLPDPHPEWFQLHFVDAVFRGRSPKQHEGFRHVGVEVALAVYKITDFDPFRNLFDSEARRIEVCYQNLGPLSRLGLFVLRRMEKNGLDVPFETLMLERVAPKVVELARLASAALSQSVSQSAS